MRLRHYRFLVDVVDEPKMSDEDFEAEVSKHLKSYFEAFGVDVDLIEVADYTGLEPGFDMAEA